MNRKIYYFTGQYLIGGSLFNLFSLLARNGLIISLVYIPRFFYLLIMNLLLSPFNCLEEILYGRRINSVIIQQDPVFILGYWRSGTTCLHNILSLDPRFGFLTTTHAFFPGMVILGKNMLPQLLKKILPEKRLIDEVDMAPGYPQEDEFVMANTSRFSFFHGFVFPRKGSEYFKKYVLFQQLNTRELDAWKKTYMACVKKLAFINPGKILLLKNPANTAKVDLLLELFPGAKFIFLYRNVYETYLSNLRTIEKMVSVNQLQTTHGKMSFKEMNRYYPEVMRKYQTDKSKIPAGNLVEIRYEDLIKYPLEQVRNIYNKLQLNGFEGVEEKIKEYINSQKEFTLSHYQINKQIMEMIDNEWNIDSIGYQ
ncbi:MAG: sulfotransferase [Bacteroidetes bacterium]|nr:sulfotransferase [Bacteroidota bacterium]